MVEGVRTDAPHQCLCSWARAFTPPGPLPAPSLSPLQMSPADQRAGESGGRNRPLWQEGLPWEHRQDVELPVQGTGSRPGWEASTHVPRGLAKTGETALKQSRRWLCAENGGEGEGRKWGPVGNKRGPEWCWWLPWSARSGQLCTALEGNCRASLRQRAEQGVKAEPGPLLLAELRRRRRPGGCAGGGGVGEARFGGDARQGLSSAGDGL